MIGPGRPQFVLFGSSIVQQCFADEGWGAILADLYDRKVPNSLSLISYEYISRDCYGGLPCLALMFCNLLKGIFNLELFEDCGIIGNQLCCLVYRDANT